MDKKSTGQSSAPALGEETISAGHKARQGLPLRRFAVIHVLIAWVLVGATDFFSEAMAVIIPPLRDWMNAAKGRFLI